MEPNTTETNSIPTDSGKMLELSNVQIAANRQKEFQNKCPHQKPNGVTNIAGQRIGMPESEFKQIFICQYCLKEWSLYVDIPPILQPALYKVGSPENCKDISLVETYQLMDDLAAEEVVWNSEVLAGAIYRNALCRYTKMKPLLSYFYRPVLWYYRLKLGMTLKEAIYGRL